MKHYLIILLIALCQLSFSQRVVQAEYFWDTDPGQGNAIAIAAQDGNFDEIIEELFTGAVSIPSAGLHKFGIRVKGEDNSWSSVFNYVINVTNQTVISRDSKVVLGEYFWDTDPGQGNAIAIAAQDGNFDEIIEELFTGAVSIPSAGLHKFGIRVKGEDNTWSSVFNYVINVTNQTIVSRDSKVVQAEYYWDTDPGQGNGFPAVAYDGVFDREIENILSQQSTTPGTGAHVFYLRVKGFDNTWSNSFGHVVNILDSNSYVNIPETICYGASYTVPSGSATYTQSGIYNDTLTNHFGYDSIMTINLTVLSQIVSNINATACGSYFWSLNNTTYTSSGTYNTVLTSSGGCDSTVILTLTINNATNSSQTTVACDSYVWPVNGSTYTGSGVYTAILTNAAGCDSTITLNLTINNATASSQTAIACDTYVWPVNGSTYTTSGTYNAVLPNAAGCDSVITLNLTINNGSTITQSIASCDSYTWPVNNNTYTSSGTYSETFTKVNGCDSIIILNLTIGTANSATENTVACDSYVWPANGSTYTSSGTYSAILTNASGCDSTITLNLIVKNSSASSQSAVACGSYLWQENGLTYTTSGTYNAVLTNAAGCDSIITLTLTVNPTYNLSESVSICNGSSYTLPNGSSVSTAGTYTSNLTTMNGCDSIIVSTVNVTVPIVSTTVSGGITIVADAAGVMYQWIDCNNGNAIISGETFQSYSPVLNGDYAVIINDNSCIDTSACVNINNIGIESITSSASIEVYPNPATDVLKIRSNNEETELILINALGETVMKSTIQKGTSELTIKTLESGVYQLMFVSGKSVQISKLIITK